MDISLIKKVSLIILVIASMAYKPLAIILAVFLVIDSEWVTWILGIIYRDSLAPRIEVTGAYRRGVRRGSEWLAFYRFEPLEDISTSGVRVIDVIQEFLTRINLTSIELGFFKIRLGNEVHKVLRVAYRDASEFEGIKPLLLQYFRLEELPDSLIARLLGEFEPIPKYWLALALIILLIYGTPIKYNLAYGLLASIAYAYTMYRASRRLMVNRTPVRFRSIVAKSELLYSNYTNNDAYTYAMSIAQLPSWGIVIREDPALRGRIEQAYASYREKAVTRVRGRYEVESGRLWNAVQRLNNGERTYRIGIWLDAESPIPNTRLGKAINWLSEPWLPALTRDITIMPILHGAQVTSGLRRAVVEVGVDRFNNPVSLDFDALSSAHGLIIGPTGMGKTKTTMSLILRLIKSGVRFMILDPEDEYCQVLARLGFTCIYAGDAYIDFLKPGFEEAVVKASDVYEAFKHAYGVEDSSIFNYYNKPYTGLINAIDWFIANSPYANYWRIIKGLLPRQLVSLESLLASNVVIKYTDRGSGRTLRQDDRYLTLIMELLITEAFRAFLTVKSPSELVTNVIIADEAYLVLGSRAIWSLIRAGRKRGLALWFATQSIKDAPASMVQNIGWGLILAGPDAYIDEVKPYFGLSQVDVEWLRKSLTPRVLGGYSMGILYVPPTPRHVFIRLEEAVF